MKKTVLAAALSIALLVFAAPAAEACTASGMLDYGQFIRGTAEYNAIRDVVVTDIAIPRGWTSSDAVDATVGTIAIFYDELWGFNNPGLPDPDMTVASEIRAAMESPIGGDLLHGIGPEEFGEPILRLKHHAILHGHEWETGMIWTDDRFAPFPGWEGEYLDEPQDEEEEPADNPSPVTFDHAG
jgi:hypothetical protein